MTPRQKLGEARVNTFMFLPYLASYIYGMKAHERPGLGTACVDAAGNLYWDAQYITSVTTGQASYIIAHEVLHLVFQHHRRALDVLGPDSTSQQQFIMNIAADLVVEQTLRQCGIDHWVPDGVVKIGCTVPQLGGLVLDFPYNLSMEEYYRRILDLLREQSKEQQPQSEEDNEDGDDDNEEDSGDTGSDGEDSTDSSADSEDDSEGEAGGGEVPAPSGQGESAPMPGSPGGGGSCADGQPRDYEVEDDGSWHSYAADNAAALAEQAIEECLAANPGKHIPQSIKQALQQALRPQPDPFDKLRSAVATSVAAPVGGRDFSHRRLSRKQPNDDKAPLLHGRICTQPNAVVIVDTSGSMMGSDTQAKALSVIGQGLRKLGRVKVICADTIVRSSKSIVNTRMFEWDGGGGTDMRRAIEDVDRTDKPDSIILITDAITGWPSQKPRARVVVAYTGEPNSRYHSSIPSWARTVVLSQ